MTDSDPTLDPALAIAPELDPCGCCDGLSVQTPRLIENRAGLSAIAYRAGTHGSFLETLLVRLATSDHPALRDLTTRASDDFTLALLDAWATVGDVISFYQERIANESYLRTAAERLSLIYLARLIGYKLRPGLAAETVITFTMEDAPGAPARATLPSGTQVQSVPEQGQQPQTFETVEEIEARPAWNSLRPRRSAPFDLKALVDKATASNPPQQDLVVTLTLDGLVGTLKPGDLLLLPPAEGDKTIFGIVLAVSQLPGAPPAASTNPLQLPSSRPEPPVNRTLVTVQLPEPGSVSKGSPKGNDVIAALTRDQPAPPPLSARAKALIDGLPAAKRIAADDLEAAAKTEGWLVQELFDNVAAAAAPPPQIWVLKTRAAIFGHNAPPFKSLPAALTDFQLSYAGAGNNPTPKAVAGPYANKEGEWADARSLGTYPDTTLTSVSGRVQVPLDAVYQGLQAESFALLRDRLAWGIYGIKRASERSMALFTLTGKVSLLDLSVGTANQLLSFSIRSTTVYGEPAPLTLARVPRSTDVAGMTIALEGLVQGLRAGQRIVVTGELANQRGVIASEPAELAEVEYDFSGEPYTLLTLTKGLANSFVLQTTTINANAARATHGEKKAEILGSGDGSKEFQRFTLKQPPLTTISAQNPEGRQSTLEVRVNGLLWSEVPSLYGQPMDARVYITTQEEDGSTTVQFGDGLTGARLPTGRENVRADYRKGAGTSGLLKPEQISLLMTRPQGVRSASNPVAATGGQDPDTVEQIRQNAPLPILTLGRIVSLQDYQGFARAFSGIAKALATWTWHGQARGVFVTVAGPGGAEIADDSAIRKNLIAAMVAAGDPEVHLQVKSYKPAFFRLAARVKFLPEYRGREADVRAAIETRLRTAFSFDARAFGQPVEASEVVALIQGTPGVMATVLDTLYRSKSAPAYNPRLTASAPTPGAAMDTEAAELLTLDPAPIELGDMP